MDRSGMLTARDPRPSLLTAGGSSFIAATETGPDFQARGKDTEVLRGFPK